MKKQFLERIGSLLMGIVFVSMTALVSCGDDDEPAKDPEVTAAFNYTVDGLTVTMQNASVGAETYAWDFGDGSTSAEFEPVYTYTIPGVYNVTLTASNPTFENTATAEVTTENAGPIAQVVLGKTWIPARENTFAYALGPEDGAGVDWDYSSPLWFGWGDHDPTWQQLIQRPSLANDEYFFNYDGTYTVDFNGDFWGEFGVWAGTDYNEVDIDISGGSLPNNTNSEPVSDWIAGTWNWEINEDNKTLTVIGSGAHILNPRLVNDNFSLVPVNQVVYTVEKAVSGPQADTLIVYTTCNDGSNLLREYRTLIAYHSVDVPPMRDLPSPQYPNSVLSSSIGHTFEGEEGSGEGVGSVAGPYTVTYGETIDGKVGAKFERAGDDEGHRWANYLMRTDQSEIDFSSGTTVSVEVYFPSTNVYEGGLTRTIWIRFIDESRLGGDFWQEYIQLESAEIPEDTWTTVTLDFSTAISEGAAAGNSPDGVMIEFGGSDHLVGGTFYARNWTIGN